MQVKLNAKQEKKYRNRLMAAGTATSGLSSTLAFTPVQVREGGGGTHMQICGCELLRGYVLGG